MGGRFGKYGDAKRRQTLRKMRREKFGLESGRLRAKVQRSKQACWTSVHDRRRDHGPSGADHRDGRQPVDTP